MTDKDVVTVRVMLFSHLKYELGTRQLQMELPSTSTTGDVETEIRARLTSSSASIPIRIALNGKYITEPSSLQNDDEVALIPPVQGG